MGENLNSLKEEEVSSQSRKVKLMQFIDDFRKNETEAAFKLLVKQTQVTERKGSNDRILKSLKSIMQ